MEALAQLDLLNLEPSAKTLKTQVLTLELAHLRRIRFGVKSEALPQAQRDLFQDTWNEDSAAVEAEIERLADGRRQAEAREGRTPAVAGPPAEDRAPPRTRILRVSPLRQH